RHPRMQAIFDVVRRVAATNATVLITGESGTGKELLARLIHSLDARPRKGELVVIDCSTVVPELSGSEFFGHERGAFTGAIGPRDGAFALADEGTLFLDEIGDLPLHLQAQLLRAVQEKSYKRVGGNKWYSTRFRLICATHRAVLEDLDAGRFRHDLYYRIAGVVCRVPSLRDRPEDILTLFRHFVAEAMNRLELPEVDEAVARVLVRRQYPGNVRELKQLARYVGYRHVGPGTITMGDLPGDVRPQTSDAHENLMDASFEASVRRSLARGAGLKDISRLAGEAAIRVALGDAQGNVKSAAQRLHVTERALQLRRAARRDELVTDPAQEDVPAREVGPESTADHERAPRRWSTARKDVH
ncbi:MAG: sigma 54-interacting transcriptional regulator, partial [Longimicrobiales bacterium]